MQAAGRWDMTLQTPMGPQQMQLSVAPCRDGFSGRVDGPMGGHDVSGSIDGDTLRFVLAVTRPFPVKVDFRLTIDGDAIRGHAKAGLFGKAAVIGARLADDAAAVAACPDDGPIGPDFVDPQFREPYIEIDEWRAAPAPHRYVRGGFKDTDARFSFYFPPPAQYEGRFFHNTYPLATTSDVGPFPIAFDVATGDLAFTFASGAYYVQTNLGGADRAPPADPAIGAYRVNAAAAQYSRVLAAAMYGEHRAWGYLFGGSGGSYQVMGAAENTFGIWDGFVPFVLATPNAMPSLFSVRMHALRVLRRRQRLAGIADAVDAGGSGDPYAGLDDEERAALREATRLGFPLRGWWNHAEIGSGYFSKIAGMVPMLDPGYVDDFWTQPGYLGGKLDDPIHAERFSFETRVRHVCTGPTPRIELEQVPDRDFTDAHLVLLEGHGVGLSAPLVEIDGHSAGFSISADPRAVAAVTAGARVRIDNAWALALQTYQRHQVPDAGLCGWDQYRDADGTPLYPQRELLVGPIGTAGTAGAVPEGSIHGKMIAVECLMDIDAFPWQADWYRRQVRAALGARCDEQFALWYVDRAQHDNPSTLAAQAHVVNFSGVLQQALRDVAAWVEHGVQPARSRYRIDDAQVVVPASAAERGGIQPVVALQANGGARADVACGVAVRFTASIEVPPGTGCIIAAAWDFDGSGAFADPVAIDAPCETLRTEASHAYAQPGTYFAVLRATAHRDGDPQARFARIDHLARVRIVVR